MYVSLRKKNGVWDFYGLDQDLSRSMSGSRGEHISLFVWLNIMHRCWLTVSGLLQNNGCATFSQQHENFSCSLVGTVYRNFMCQTDYCGFYTCS